MKPFLYSVLPRPPHPSRDGLAIRNYYLLEALTERFEVRAFSLLDPERAYGRGRLPPGVEVEWVPQRPRRARRLAAIGSSLASGLAYSELLYRSGALARRVAEGSAAETPELDRRALVPRGAARSRRGRAGVGGLPQPRLGDLGPYGTPASRPGSASSRGQAPRVRGSRRRCWPVPTGLVRVAARRGRVRGLGRPRSPSSCPTAWTSRATRSEGPPAEEMILFVGDLSWPPNAEGVRWFARRCGRSSLAPAASRGWRSSAAARRRTCSALAMRDFAFAGRAGHAAPLGAAPPWRSCRSWRAAARG